MKSDGRVGRCHLKARGLCRHVVLTAVDHNLCLVLTWLSLLLRLILNVSSRLLAVTTAFKRAS